MLLGLPLEVLLRYGLTRLVAVMLLSKRDLMLRCVRVVTA